MSMFTHLLETITRKLWLELQQRLIEEGFDVELKLVDGEAQLDLRATREHSGFDHFDYAVSIRHHWTGKSDSVCLDTHRDANRYIGRLAYSNDIDEIIEVVYSDVADYLSDFLDSSHINSQSRLDLAKFVIAETPFKIVSVQNSRHSIMDIKASYEAQGWTYHSADSAYSSVIMIFVK